MRRARDGVRDDCDDCDDDCDDDDDDHDDEDDVVCDDSWHRLKSDRE